MLFNQQIKIGFLTPYSSIYPGLTPNIVNGFYCSMPEQYQNMFHFQPEYVKQGGGNTVKDAILKLIQFDNVDIISGLVSYRKIPEIAGIMEQRKKLAFFFDMGEYIPYTQHISNHLFFNSFQLWQSEYALGFWAQKEFGDKGAVIMPIYDAGYHLHSSFRQGTVSAGSKLIDYHILPYSEGKSQVKGQLKPFFEKLKKEKPSYIHALFCGTEALDFFTEFEESGLAGKIPLVVSAHMATEEMLDLVSNISLKMYSASMWDCNSTDVLNTKFKQQYTLHTGAKADLFSLLGYEMGVLFGKLIPDLAKRDWDSVIQNMKNETIKSPRGDRNFFLDSNYSTPIIDIEKIEIGSGKVNKMVINQGCSLKYNHEIFSEIHNECVSGWQNPYLCV
ncbi:MAG: ABC transporter substrate-binding protein [Paludibacteraceae bacterium]|nr:ABC transporter substrate-binding protein [Paludibacteraceae bacterium]